MRAHGCPRPTLLARRALPAALALTLACTAGAAAQDATATGPSGAPLAHAAGRHAAHGKRPRAKHALTCRVLRRRLARHTLRSRRNRTRAIACRRAARRRRIARVKRHRLALRRAAAHRRHVAVPGPTQVASASTRGSAQGWDGFGAGSWPGATWRPYGSSSPFNRSVAGAQVHPRSDAIVREVLSWGDPGNLMAGTADTTSDYGHPTYYAQPGDPLYTLDSSGYSPAIEGVQIHVPSAARPAAGGDGHMTIVEPDGWEYDLWQVTSKPAGGGALRFELGGRTRIDGSGLDSNATAARFGNLAGVIRYQELAAGHIDHALFIVLKCTSGETSFGYGTQADDGKSAFVYPASAGGSECSGSESADAPPMGARFQLAMSDAQIAALDVPDWKKTILTALAHYGGYVGDTGGPGFGLMLESSTTYTAFGFADPLRGFAQQNGIAPWNGMYPLNIAAGVDWAKDLRVMVPPAAS